MVNGANCGKVMLCFCQTVLRMHIARGWLRQGRWTVSEVTNRLGYESEASFSRAFKRIIGIPPSVERRANLDSKSSLNNIA